MPRSGTSNYGGKLLQRAEMENDTIYHDVVSSGLGALRCLRSEVYGRFGTQAAELLPALATERTRGIDANLRKGLALGLLHRWAGILGVALQRAVARSILRPGGALPHTPLEPACPLAELEVV